MKRLAIAVMLVFSWGFNARAALLYWDGSDSTADADGGSGTWNTSNPNWDDAATGGSSVAWGTSSDAFFGGTAGIVTLGEDITAGTVTFDVSGYEIATAGHVMTLDVLAGPGDFTKSGAGTLLVTGKNGYGGRINVRGGVLKAGTFGDVFGINPAVDKMTVSSGATFDVAGYFDMNIGITLNGTGITGQGAYINSGGDTGFDHVQVPNIALASDATIGGSGNFYTINGGYGPTSLNLNGHTLTKVGANNFCMINATVSAGNVHVAEGGFGVIAKSSDASAAAFTLADDASAALVLNSQSLSVGSLAGGGAVGGNVMIHAGALTVGALNTSNSFAGAIIGSGTLIKTGTNVWVVSGQSGFGGRVIVSNGTLKAGTGWNVLGANMATDKVTVASGATFDVAGYFDMGIGLTLAGTGIAGQGAFINSGADTGFTHIQTPNIALAADATIGGSGNFYMINDSYNSNALSLNGHTLTKVGTNTFCMVNTTVSTGSVHIAEGGFGVVARGSDASAAAFTLANNASAALMLNNQSLSVGSLAGGGATGGNVLLNAGTLTIAGSNTATDYAGQISGSSGSLVKSGNGTQSLSGPNNYTGSTTVSNGTLLVNGSHTGEGGYVVTGGAALGGTGIVTLTSGTVDVQANATLAPGAAANAGGMLTLSSLTMAPTAKLAIDSPSDQIVVTGNLSLDNTFVTISNTNLFSTAGGSAYPIVTCNGIITGKFEPKIEDTRWVVKRAGTTFYLRYNYPGALLLVR